MRIPTVHVMLGPPASGKSTLAKHWIEKNPNLVRLNRDDFRMSFFGKFILDKPNEKKLTEIIKTIALSYLKQGVDIVLDNTHCNLKTLQQIELDYIDYANISYHPTNVELKTLIERNAARENPVPVDVIRRMYSSYQHIQGSFDFTSRIKREIIPINLTEDKIDVYVFDIDRTLCTPFRRNVYDFLKADTDIPIISTIDIYNSIKENIGVLFITGRPEYSRQVTLGWLNQYSETSILSEELYMRKNGDNRSSRIVKEEILNEVKEKYNIVGWFDDDEEVVEMLKLYGVNVYNTKNY